MDGFNAGIGAAVGAGLTIVFKFILDLINTKSNVQKDERKDAWDEAQKLRQELAEQLFQVRGEIAALREGNLGLAVENANLKAIVAELRKENALLMIRVLDMQSKLGGIQPVGKGGLVVTDEMGMIQIWTSRMQELFGWKAMEILGKSLVDVLVPDDHKLRKTGYFDKLREMTSESFLFEPMVVPGKAKNGAIVEIKLTPMGWKAGGVWTFAAVCRKMDDATGRALMD